MLLLLMRHGIAEEPETWEGEDATRPLTNEGKKKTRAIAERLSTLVDEVDLIASSPLVRARQTAEIVQKAFHRAPLATWPELEDAQYSALVKRLKTLEIKSALLVGHEPSLGTFAARCLTGKADGFALEMKKAGVCALEVDWSTPGARAVLLWHTSPKLLRAP